VATFVVLDTEDFFDALLLGALSLLVLGGVAGGVGGLLGDANLVGFSVPTMVFGVAATVLAMVLDTVGYGPEPVVLYASVRGCEEVEFMRLSGYARRLYYGDGLWVYRVSRRVACYFIPFRRSRALCVDLRSPRALGCLVRYIQGARVRPLPLRGDEVLDLISVAAGIA